jgi:hypothetical protein
LTINLNKQLIKITIVLNCFSSVLLVLRLINNNNNFMDKNLINNNSDKKEFIFKHKNKSKLTKSDSTLNWNNLTPNISVIKRQISNKLSKSEQNIANNLSIPLLLLLSKQTSTPKMSSRRELNSLKSDLKQSVGKTGKRTSTQTQILDLTPETKRVSKSNSFSLLNDIFLLIINSVFKSSLLSILGFFYYSFY